MVRFTGYVPPKSNFDTIYVFISSLDTLLSLSLISSNDRRRQVYSYLKSS